MLRLHSKYRFPYPHIGVARFTQPGLCRVQRPSAGDREKLVTPPKRSVSFLRELVVKWGGKPVSVGVIELQQEFDKERDPSSH